MANTSTPIETIVKRSLQGELITAYQIAKIINSVLAENGVMKDGKIYQIRPQMMYNYDRNGLIVKGKKGVCHYALGEVYTFVNRYLAKYECSWNYDLDEDECRGQLELV